ncbi:flagellar hook-basal body protein [Peribacillus sp. Hz7]|uniref:flagellar hook-basal body protein n=1 Tax=Peribacillus sp. Hz7 TaxID=3344873 RepID=UPI0035C9D66A
MNRTMIAASNTLGQLQKQIDVISNNMANVETTGFKRGEASFTDLLVQQLNNQPNQAAEVGRLTPLGIRQGNGAKIGQIQNVQAQGSLKATNRNLDVAFTKENLYFMIGVEEGNVVRLSRDGAFYLSPNGNENMLVTADGHTVLDENGNDIVIEGDIKEIQISDEGTVKAITTDGGEQTFNLGVVSVQKPQFLEKLGDNLYGLPDNYDGLGVTADDVLTELTGALRTDISVKQGVLESSNVDLSKEMTDLITAQRMYQFQSRSITMADQMLGLVNSIR